TAITSICARYWRDSRSSISSNAVVSAYTFSKSALRSRSMRVQKRLRRVANSDCGSPGFDKTVMQTYSSTRSFLRNGLWVYYRHPDQSRECDDAVGAGNAEPQETRRDCRDPGRARLGVRRPDPVAGPSGSRGNRHHL